MTVWVTPLPERIAKTTPLIEARTPEDYFKRVIRPCLLRAANEGKLVLGGPHVISQHVRLSRRSSIVPERGAQDLVGGDKDFSRNTELAALRTADGGSFSFSAVLQPHEGKVQTLAYNVERVYGWDREPSWIRFDYSPPGHENERRGLRSHFHPAHPDLQLPAPVFALHELIDLLLTPPSDQSDRKPRTKGGPSNSA